MASTVLPNGTIIPEKYSRDWYNDLYHNWQELDNLLGGGTPKDGTLTIQKNGATVGTFSANQATDETINITVPAKTSDLTNDSDFVPSTDLATVATSGSYNDLSNKPTIPTVNNGTLTIQKNGANVQTFTANQSTNATANITVPTKTSDLTNDSGFITEDTTKIPLAGSNAISGSLIPATDDVYELGSNDYRYAEVHCNLFRGSPNINFIMNYQRGGFVVCRGANVTGQVAGQITFSPWVSSSNYQEMNLYPDGSWWWSGQAVQIGSDARLKQQIKSIDDDLLTAWEDVKPVQFKYNDAVSEKGDKARLHTGYVVQQIDSACKSHGVDVSAYGLYCHEEYPEETEEVEIEQADGTKVKETKVIREASEHYSLRYTEVYAVECMYLRRCIARLTARIEELEKGNNTK